METHVIHCRETRMAVITYLYCVPLDLRINTLDCLRDPRVKETLNLGPNKENPS